MVVKRIISLLPSATEIVCALDAGDQLVGRSHECDFPPEVKRLPACTSAKLDAHAGSAAIDREMKNLFEAASAIYEIDTAMLERLKPDIILTQAQCEVCAVSLNEVEAALGKWVGKRPQVVSLSPKRLADIWQDFRTVSEALDMVEHGRDILRGLKTRVVNIIEKSCVVQPHPTVLCVEWIEPLMAAGNWVPELVELAAGADVLGQPGKHSAWTNWETIQKLNPEIIIAMPCGFDLQKTRAEMSALTKLPGWKDLRAVKNNRVYLTDGNQYLIGQGRASWSH